MKGCKLMSEETKGGLIALALVLIWIGSTYFVYKIGLQEGSRLWLKAIDDCDVAIKEVRQSEDQICEMKTHTAETLANAINRELKCKERRQNF